MWCPSLAPMKLYVPLLGSPEILSNGLRPFSGLIIMQRMIRRIIVVIVAIGLCASATSCWAGYAEGLRAYERGDYATALWEWGPLAEQGHATAQFNLGSIYDKGQGVPQDYAQAMQWHRRAAEQGHAGGQNNLGVMYHEGQGVPQDYAQAYLWSNLAAARLPPGADREGAVRNRDLTAARLTPTQLADAQARARTWQPKPETPSSPSAPSPGFAVPVQGAPPSASPPASLRRDLIREVQERLQAAGFHPGTIDGSMGPQTRNALRWFQNTKGLLATGELDEKTLDALGVR